MSTIRAKDNSPVLLSEATEEDLANLRYLSDRTVGTLVKESPGLLVFPSDVDSLSAGIGEQRLIQWDGSTARAGNLMGFVRRGGTLLGIHSRFANDDGRDYFLHYMLQRVMSLNLFDLPFPTADEDALSLLVYLFPSLLRRALRQGIYQEYRSFEYNDTNVRGAIDVPRHLRHNIPFAGRVAYRTHEYTADNDVIQLIRHTIEYIDQRPTISGLLRSPQVQPDVRTIRELTPTYDRHQREAIIHRNLRPIRHPYYSDYRLLQQLCLHILREENTRYGSSENEVYGLLFDGAWLWENYLATVLPEFVHADNILCAKHIHAFVTPKGFKLYPDLRTKDFVLDAKYKRYESGVLSADDLHQVVSYMYLLQVGRGGVAVPAKETLRRERTLNGYGGTFGVYGLKIASAALSFMEFAKSMRQNEDDFRDTIRNASNHQ